MQGKLIIFKGEKKSLFLRHSLARVFHLSMSLLLKRTIKEHKFEEK